MELKSEDRIDILIDTNENGKETKTKKGKEEIDEHIMKQERKQVDPEEDLEESIMKSLPWIPAKLPGDLPKFKAENSMDIEDWLDDYRRLAKLARS